MCHLSQGASAFALITTAGAVSALLLGTLKFLAAPEPAYVTVHTIVETNTHHLQEHLPQ